MVRKERVERLVTGALGEGYIHMAMSRGRRCPAALASALRAAGIGAMTVVLLTAPARASTGEDRIADQRDVGTRVDLKALTHAREGSSIVYTAETHTPVSDQLAALKWGIDRDGDEAFDLFVFTEWRAGKLIGGVKDSGSREVATATVARPGPTLIKVTFPAAVLGDVGVYRYALHAGTAGDRDLAPNAGLIQHRLDTVGSPSAPPARIAGSSPVAEPKAASPSPAGGVAAATPAPAPRPVTQAAPKASLPKTGPANRMLVQWSGAALMVGGALVVLGAQRRGVRRRQVTGGIR
jgi:LPXTG-motif cell wall-anchored protein